MSDCARQTGLWKQYLLICVSVGRTCSLIKYKLWPHDLIDNIYKSITYQRDKVAGYHLFLMRSVCYVVDVILYDKYSSLVKDGGRFPIDRDDARLCSRLLYTHITSYKLLTFVTTDKIATTLRISCQAPMLRALAATGLRNCVVNFHASTLTSRMLLKRARSGASGNEATNNVMKPNWITV